ncbi:hypothetical protein P3W85_30030 [Cupriavidus basilensis]|uniref:Phage protein n=1 Tax=Cupriavidus basilensis TaxID=68895 RepID=A0ABT6AXS8_9BURK|nr:hypothetical protein [Cupriavidus basilensis]MDF3837163.1 hypothetical protein [Cupriavidus basilensis]
MSEPISGGAAAGAAGTAIAKYFGLQLGAGAVAAALGFLVLWPKTAREGFARLVSSIMSSIVFGPALVAFVYSRYPDVFASARTLAVAAGVNPEFGMLYAGAPLLVIAGLPAWWVLGAILRWFDKRRDKDIGELAEDVRDAVGGAKNG